MRLSFDDPGRCTYYLGTGKCSRSWMNCSFYGEPRCMTDEPHRGWPSSWPWWKRLLLALRVVKDRNV